LSYFIVDERTALFGVGQGNTNAAIRVDASALARMIEEDFNQLWENSEDFVSFVKRTFNSIVNESGEPAALSLVRCPNKNAFQDWINNVKE
jgi:hypothetical protein